jgi:lysyl-tRNA synthetase, class II
MHTPDYHNFEEFKNRNLKLEEIKQMGIDPFPAVAKFENRAKEIHDLYLDKPVGHSDDAMAGVTPYVKMAGRLKLFRSMGKNAFAQIKDATGMMQIMFNRDQTEVEGFDRQKHPETTPLKFIEKKIDLGDVIGVEGYLFRTQMGELTVLVKKFVLLTKTLLPLPDKYAGLTDKGVRYRKRWLDLISNDEAFETFKIRSRMTYLLRKAMHGYGFMEVETPVLQNLYGGAEARPFTTHLNAQNQDMFLRIALEIQLKKLIVGGYERVYEIGKVFRNEGIDRTHNPEFTMMEAYAAYFDYNDMMRLTEHIFETIAIDLFGTTKLKVTKDDKDYEIDVKGPWKTISMIDAIKVYEHIDVMSLSDDQLKSILKEKTDLKPEEFMNNPRGLLIADIFGELVEKHLIQPHHIIDHPIETTPLCKPHRDPKLREMGLVERFESFIMGAEFCNSYTELNDPILQRALLEDQASKRDAGDEEASPLDEEFIEAICQGMPPTGGLGIGIDRMAMLFCNAASIRDVLFFPIMRPEEG